MILILGYGNTLRGDDGVGYEVAETVAAWQLPQVRSLPVFQLMPELAESIAQVDRVIFVDAIGVQDGGAGSLPEIHVQPLLLFNDPPSQGKDVLACQKVLTGSFRTHLVTPWFLLAIAQRLYGATPAAELLTIPAIDFTLGQPLSSLASRGKALALDYLQRVLSDNQLAPRQGA